MATEAPAQADLGEKNLTTIHAVAQALAIGPMFSVALVLGSVSRPDIGAGWNATLAVLIAGLGVMAIGYALTLFARRYAGAGAVYEYLTHGAHPAVGIFAAGIFFVGTLFLGGGGIYLGLGILWNGFWAEHIGSAANAPAWWVFGLIMVGLVLILNYLGVRIAIGAMLTFAACSFIPMLLLAIIIVAKGGEGGVTFTMFNPGETSLSRRNGRWRAGRRAARYPAVRRVRGGCIDRRGVERIRTSRFPAPCWRRSQRRPSSSCSWPGRSRSATARSPSSKGAWAFSPSPVDELATKYVGHWYAALLDILIILDATALALAICVTIGRGYFALGRDGLLPSFFARTSRHNTPWVGNLMIIVGGVGLMLLVKFHDYFSQFVLPDGKGGFIPLFPSNEFATFILAATIGSFAIEIVYLFLAVGGLVLLAKHGAKWWQWIVVGFAVIVPLAGFYGALKPAPHGSANYNWVAMYWTVGILVLAAVWFVICRMIRPANVANAASHAAGHHGVAPLDENLDFTPAPPDTTI